AGHRPASIESARPRAAPAPNPLHECPANIMPRRRARLCGEDTAVDAQESCAHSKNRDPSTHSPQFHILPFLLAPEGFDPRASTQAHRLYTKAKKTPSTIFSARKTARDQRKGNRMEAPSRVKTTARYAWTTASAPARPADPGAHRQLAQFAEGEDLPKTLAVAGFVFEADAVLAPGNIERVRLHLIEVPPERAQELRDARRAGALRREAFASFSSPLRVEPGNVARIVTDRAVLLKRMGAHARRAGGFQHGRLADFDRAFGNLRQILAANDVAPAILLHHEGDDAQRLQRLADGPEGFGVRHDRMPPRGR